MTTARESRPPQHNGSETITADGMDATLGPAVRKLVSDRTDILSLSDGADRSAALLLGLALPPANEPCSADTAGERAGTDPT